VPGVAGVGGGDGVARGVIAGISAEKSSRLPFGEADETILMVTGEPDRGRLMETVSPIDHGHSMLSFGKGTSLSLRRMATLSQGSGSPPVWVMNASFPETERLNWVDVAGEGARKVE